MGPIHFHGQIPAYSLSGPQLAVRAPGGAQDDGQILSTNSGGVYRLGYGTGQAAAHATGAVTLALLV